MNNRLYKKLKSKKFRSWIEVEYVNLFEKFLSVSSTLKGYRIQERVKREWLLDNQTNQERESKRELKLQKAVEKKERDQRDKSLNIENTGKEIDLETARIELYNKKLILDPDHDKRIKEIKDMYAELFKVQH